MKVLLKRTLVLILMTVIASCKKDTRPNYQFMPNMYEPVGYETFGEYDIFPGDQSALIPVDGTIARGYSLFDFGNSNEEYLRAKKELNSPLDAKMVDLKKGKALYDIYCGICHGNKGDGQGYLVKREKILGIPSYADVGRAINEGSTYHTIYFGKNAMGSYAGQLNEEERWQVVAYVLKLKLDLEN